MGDPLLRLVRSMNGNPKLRLTLVQQNKGIREPIRSSESELALTKPESASGPVEVEVTIQVKYTLVDENKSNEMSPGWGHIHKDATTL